MNMEAQPVQGTPTADVGESETLAEVSRLSALLCGLSPASTECEALDRITAFEELKATLAAAQSREAVGFEQLRIRRDALNNVPAARQGVRAGDEIGFARKSSPGSGRKFLTTARTLTDLPDTFEALTRGTISEAKANVIADETADLSGDERRRVDRRIRNSLSDSGIKSLRHEARALAAEIAADTAADRAARAAANRRVTMTPLPHGMGRVSAILPMIQAVAVSEALKSGADSAIAQGKALGRRHAQVMADLLVERTTGLTKAKDVPVEVHVVIEVESLLSRGAVPAWLPGYGPLPAKEARNFIAANRAQVLLRRLFTTPHEGQLVGMESKARVFSGLLRRMVVFRDDVCRSPWCDAPIKHADHVNPAAAGGPTTWENASGLCASCNFAKEHPGWGHETIEVGLIVRTPTGRRYSVSKRPLVTKMRQPRRSPECPPGKRDWRQALAGFMEPSAQPPPQIPPSPRQIPPPTGSPAGPDSRAADALSPVEELLRSRLFADSG